MANPALATTSAAFSQLASLSQLSIVRQMGLMLVIATSIALGTSVVLWSRDEPYSVLYPDATAQDNAEMIGVLEQNQIAYEIDSRSGLISVQTTEVQQTRLLLATQGLPRSTSTGFSSLDESQPLGTSNFVEQTRYTRALEQELVTTIKLIRGVRDARVHLSIPKQTSFVRNGNKPSASVMLDIVGGQAISDIQIAGIAHLVSASVAGMDSADVSIVDQKGSLLSRSEDADFQSSSEQVKFTRELEQEYTQRIMAILSPLVGEDKVHAQVTADLDFTIIETTEENYDPQQVVVRSEQTQEENRATPSATLPGELTQTPPVPLADGTQAAQDQIANANTAAVNNQSRLNSTRNFEIDRSVSHRRTVPGGINRLSVAVVVDLQPPQAAQTEDGEQPAAEVPALTPEQTAERIEKLTRLVKDTIGFNEARGDSVNVISDIFTQDAALLESPPLPLWEQPWAWSAARQGGASIVVLLLIFAVLRPAMKSVVKPAINITQTAPNAITQMASPINVKLDGDSGMQKLPAKSAYDENLQLAQNLVKSEPARAARMIKDWVAND
jgi:flagellar M-ring protein FliF